MEETLVSGTVVMEGVGEERGMSSSPCRKIVKNRGLLKRSDESRTSAALEKAADTAAFVIDRYC